MMTKIKQRVIVILLVIAITASAIITIGLNTTTSARADSGYVDVPQITVLTHGLSSRASHWSNANGTGSGGFVQDTDSLLYKLSVKAGGAYIYRAETSSNSGQNPIYTLYDGYTTTTSNAANSCDCITDVSKHIIIVFDSEDSGGSNDTIYSEFKHMLNDVIARVTSLNQGQKKPKINLIGHSRGGITNLQYTLDYPEYVDSLISIGTPYFGSPAAEVAGPLLFETSDGLTDINNETAYTNYYNRWKTGYESKYKNINSIAIGATTTIEYQRAVLNT